MYDHFGRRLQRDLKHIVDERLTASEIAGGGLAKVRSVRIAPSRRLINHSPVPQSTGLEVNVISHKRQRYAVWFGGSLLAQTVRRLLELPTPRLTCLPVDSPSSMASATRKRTTWSTDRRSVGDTKRLPRRRELGCTTTDACLATQEVLRDGIDTFVDRELLFLAFAAVSLGQGVVGQDLAQDGVQLVHVGAEHAELVSIRV